MPYNAFISYSHSANGELVSALHSALHRFAKPWYKPRALRIFRDRINLSVSPSLWNRIQEALDDSEFFILLASPKAATSAWVLKEVEYWCANKIHNRLLIVLTSGSIVWDTSKRDFDWERTTSLPKTFSGKFADEPLWVDLSWAVRSEQLSLRHLKFRDCVATLAATLHNRPKDELDSEDIRENRKVKWLARGAVSALVVLTFVAGVLAWIAEERLWIAMSRQLAAQSRLYLDDKLDLALLLASEATLKANTAEATNALFDAVNHNKRLITFLHGHTGFVKSLAYSPDGNTLASGDSNGEIRLWNMQSLELLSPPIVGHQGGYNHGVNHLAFSSDSKVLVSGGGDDTVRLWSIPEGTRLAEQSLGTKNGVSGIAISRNRKYVAATNGENDVITLLDGHTLAIIKSLRVGRGSQDKVVFSSNEEMLASLASYAPTRYVCLWETSKSIPIRKTKIDQWVAALEFSSDDKSLIIGWADGSIQFWDVKDFTPMTQAGQAAEVDKNIWQSVLNMDKRVLATARHDGTVILWDLKNNPPVGEAIKTGAGLIWKIAMSPSASTLAVGQRNGIIQIWSLMESTNLPPLVTKYENAVWRRVLSHDGAILATVPKSGGQEKEGTLRFWNTYTQAALGEPIETNLPIFNIAFSYDNKVIAAISGGDIYFWDVQSRDQVYEPVHAEEFVYNVAFSPDGKILALGGPNKIRLWSIEKKSMIGQAAIASQGGVWSLAFSPDGKTLASGGDDGSVLFWEVGKYGLIVQPVSGRVAEKNVRSMAFSRDGSMLVAGAEDGSILLWDVRSLHALGNASKVAPSGVWSFAFEEYGKSLVSAEEDGSIRVWEISPGAWQSRARKLANRSLNTDERKQFIGDGF